MPRGYGRAGDRGCRRDGTGGGPGDGPGGGPGTGPGLRGLLEPAVLAALGTHPAHGYDLRDSLEALTAGAVAIDPGGLYRLLRRLEEDGLVSSAWESGDHGPQRRTYRLTDDGREVLRCWVTRLEARRRAIDAIVAAAGATAARHAHHRDPARPDRDRTAADHDTGIPEEAHDDAR